MTARLTAGPAASIRVQDCARCRRNRRILSRGLCRSCYRWARKHGCLDDFRRRHRTHAETTQEYAELRSMGLTDREIATRLGYKHVDGLRQAIRDHAERTGRTS